MADNVNDVVVAPFHFVAHDAVAERAAAQRALRDAGILVPTRSMAIGLYAFCAFMVGVGVFALVRHPGSPFWITSMSLAAMTAFNMQIGVYGTRMAIATDGTLHDSGIDILIGGASKRLTYPWKRIRSVRVDTDGLLVNLQRLSIYIPTTAANDATRAAAWAFIYDRLQRRGIHPTDPARLSVIHNSAQTFFV